jgi:signal transduction histidine kinase
MRPEQRESQLFPVLSDTHLAWIRQHGEEIDAPAGQRLFTEGEPARDFYVVLEGHIRITRSLGAEETTITEHGPGQFTGELSVLTGGKQSASGHVVGPTRLVRIPAEEFRKMLATCQEMQEIILPVLAHRLHELDAVSQQQEKMVALGKLAAGLAHELNNPAAANRRAAEQMREVLKRQKSMALRLNLGCLMAEQHDRLTDFLSHITDSDQVVLDPLTRSDHEDVLSAWLDARQIPDSWRLAATFVSAGLEIGQLDTLADGLPAPMLADVLAWIEASLAVRELLDSIEKSATRMSEIVKAVKEYTYMDEADLQEMNLHEGIENTLTILAYKLRQSDVTLVRDFDASIPTICAYGSELNQVWTNLLDNAIDALAEQPAPRTITVRTRSAGADALVEILDNGSGIAPEIKNRIFDPFFTTKDVGKGTGLGLDIAYRIVVRRHHGEISVESLPGQTRFVVRLPLVPPRPSSQGEN